METVREYENRTGLTVSNADIVLEEINEKLIPNRYGSTDIRNKIFMPEKCINPDCVGGWMTSHEDETDLTIPCSRCNADKQKGKPFFAPPVIVHDKKVSDVLNLLDELKEKIKELY